MGEDVLEGIGYSVCGEVRICEKERGQAVLVGGGSGLSMGGGPG